MSEHWEVGYSFLTDYGKKVIRKYRAQVHHTGTTDHVLPWSALNRAMNSASPISDQERCDLFLRGVNGDALTKAEWASLIGANVAGDFDLTSITRLLVDEDEAKGLREVLRRIAADQQRAARDFVPEISKLLSGRIIAMREIALVDDCIESRDRILAYSPPHALIYALTLFLDPEKPFGRELRECCLPSCGDFGFRAPPTTRGQPPNHYCCADHRKQHERELARARMQEMRRKEKIQKGIDL